MITGSYAKDKLLLGINKVFDALSPTLGPAPRLVLIDSEEHEKDPLILDDGVNISKFITSDCPYEMAGIKLMRMVAHEAQKSSGDGTTSATVIAKHLITNLFEMDEHPVILEAQLKEAWEQFKEELATVAWNATTEELREVCLSALNYDETSADCVMEAFSNVGAEGIVMVHEHPGELTKVETTQGLTLNKGFVSHLFAGSRDGKVVYENPAVLVTDHDIVTFDELVPALQCAAENKKPLVIIAAGWKPHAIQNLLLNAVNGKVMACAINAPAGGEERAEIYEDIATSLGCEPILAAKGERLEDFIYSIDRFGSADMVSIDRNTTVFSGVSGDDEAIEARIEHLEQLKSDADHPFYEQKYNMRIAKLRGKIATIKVGGLTDVEVRERHERIDDAVNAVRSALTGGVVVGGGMTPYNIETGFVAFDNALKSLVRTMVLNWGREMPLNQDDWVFFDASTGRFNAYNNHLVDSHDVILNSVKAAVSVATLVLKTETILTESK